MGGWAEGWRRAAVLRGRERKTKRWKVRARGREEEVVMESEGRGWVADTLDSSPHRHADLNGGLAPGARHRRPHPL